MAYFGPVPPKGYLILTSEGRMMALLVSGERRPGRSSAQQAALFRTMMAYSGRYCIEIDKFITKVDVSWNEEWTGSNQVRFYTLQGKRLEILTDWLPHPTHKAHPMVRGILSWIRDE